MKKLILIGALICGAVISHAQTTNGIIGTATQPVAIAAGYLAANTNALAATNWSTFAAYSQISGAGAHKNGGTAGAVYYWSKYVGTQIRLQYLDTGLNSSKWMLPNGEITLQSAYQPFGANFPLTLRPLAEMGAATDLSGNLYAIAGAGTELDLYASKTTSMLQRVSVFYGYEKWEGQGRNYDVTQYGLALNFNVENIAKWFQKL